MRPVETIGSVVKQVAERAITRPASAATSPGILPRSGVARRLREPPNGFEALDLARVPRALLEEFARCVRDKHYPLYLYGAPGRGKSFAMAALYVLWSAQPAWFDLASYLRKIMRCRSSEGTITEMRANGESVQVSEASLVGKFAGASLACVDDIGLRSPSDAVYDALYELVCSRRGKPTCYTGNLPPEELHQVYDGRIASRIASGTVIEVTGGDLRLTDTRFVKV